MDEETIELLKFLADKLGTTSEHLWGVLINQAFIRGIANVSFLVALLGSSGLWVTFALNKVKKTYYYVDDELLKISIFVVVLVCAILAPLLIYNAVTSFLNPEYFALKEILRK